MSDLAPPPKSTARNWLRILAWIIPGVSAPALLLGAFALSYGSRATADLVGVAAIGLFALITIGCGFFNAILRTPERSERQMSPAKSITLSILVFLLVQVLLVPAIGWTVASGCMFVTNNI